MTNKEIYKILEQLGMVDEEGGADEFQNTTCHDIVLTTKFVDDLFLQNDENYIKKFLVCLLFNNGGNV